MHLRPTEAGMSGGIDRPWNDVLSFWFPEGHDLNIAPDRHRAYWRWRLHGGADAEIIGRFADVTERAATGQLDHWAGCAAGRLALIILLDQFSRSLWRDTPRAFAQDKAALALALEGLANGAYDAMPTPWHRITFTQPLGHTEGARPSRPHRPADRPARDRRRLRAVAAATDLPDPGSAGPQGARHHRPLRPPSPSRRHPGPRTPVSGKGRPHHRDPAASGSVPGAVNLGLYPNPRKRGRDTAQRVATRRPRLPAPPARSKREPGSRYRHDDPESCWHLTAGPSRIG